MSFETVRHATTCFDGSTNHRWVGLKGAARSTRPGRRKHRSPKGEEHNESRAVERAGAFEFLASAPSTIAVAAGDTQ